MKCKFINVLMFAAGAAIGSAVTWKVVKTKYERIVQEEINSVVETFTERANAQDKDEIVTEEDSEDETESGHQINWDELEDLDEDENDEACFQEYARLADMYSNNDKKGGVNAMANEVKKEPYVISPYDFDELEDYKKIELTYYADGVLEDETYEIVTDPEEILGPKALYTFGEYEDDAVHVRNEYLKTDFQILRDYRTYDEARSINPGRVND